MGQAPLDRNAEIIKELILASFKIYRKQFTIIKAVFFALWKLTNL
jgi:hypothetical protein